jgi:toxin ParE1/3/4
MPPERVSEFRLSPAAQQDLDGIWDYTAATWSPDQADDYLRGLGDKLALLCENPLIARERSEIDPPVRLHPYRSHVIIFRVEADHLAVIRIAHMRQRWQSLVTD